MKYGQRRFCDLAERKEAWNLQQNKKPITRRQARAVKRFIGAASTEKFLYVLEQRVPVGSAEKRRFFHCSSCDVYFPARHTGLKYPQCTACGRPEFVEDV